MLAKKQDGPLWGVEAIAAEIDRTPRQTYYLLQTKKIPATKIGALWVAYADEIHSALRGRAA